MAKAKGDKAGTEERRSAQEMLDRVAEEIDRLKKMGLDAPEAMSRLEAAQARMQDDAFHEAEMLASEGVLMARAVREMAAISVSVSQKEEAERRGVRKQVIREVGEQLTGLMSGPLSPDRIRQQASEAAEAYFNKVMGEELAKLDMLTSADAEKIAKSEAAAATAAMLENKSLAKLIGDLAKSEAAAATLKLDKTIQGILEKRIESFSAQVAGKIKIAVDDAQKKAGAGLKQLQGAIGAIQVPTPEEIEQQIDGKVSPAVDALQSDVAAQGEELTTKVDSAVAGLTGKVNAAVEGLTAQVEAELSEVKATVGSIEVPTPEEIEEQIDGKVSPVVAELTGKVDSAVQSLGSQVNSGLAEVRSALGDIEIPTPEEIEEQIDGKVSPVVEELQSNVAAQGEELTAKVDSAVSGLTGKVNAAVEGLTAQVEAELSGVKAAVEAIEVPTPEEIEEQIDGKVSPAVAGLMQRIGSSVDELTGKVDAAVQSLSSEVSTAVASVPTDEAIEATVNEAVGPALAEMDSKVESAVQALTERLSAGLASVGAKVEAQEIISSDDVRAMIDEALTPRLSEAVSNMESEIHAVASRLGQMQVPTPEEIEEMVSGSVNPAIENLTSKIQSAVAALNSKVNNAAEELTEKVDSGLERVTSRVDSIRTLSADEVQEIAEGVVAGSSKLDAADAREIAEDVAAGKVAEAVAQVSDTVASVPTREQVSSLAASSAAEAASELLASEELAAKITELAPRGLSSAQVSEIAEGAVQQMLEEAGYARAEDVQGMLDTVVAEAVSGQVGMDEIRHIASSMAAEALESATPVTAEEARSIAEAAAGQALAQVETVPPDELRARVQEAVADLKGDLLSGEDLSGMVARLAAERAAEVIADMPHITPQQFDERINMAVNDFSRAVLDSRELAEMISHATSSVESLGEDEARTIASEVAAAAVSQSPRITADEVGEIAGERILATLDGLDQISPEDVRTIAREMLAGLMAESPPLDADEARAIAREEAQAAAGGVPQLSDDDIHKIAGERITEAIERLQQITPADVKAIVDDAVAGAGGLTEEQAKSIAAEQAAAATSELAGSGELAEGVVPVVLGSDELAAKIQEMVAAGLEGVSGSQGLSSAEIDEIVEGRIQQESDRLLESEALANTILRIAGGEGGGLDEEALKALVAEKTEGLAGGLSKDEVDEIIQEKLVEAHAGEGLTAQQVDELIEGRIQMEIERALESDELAAKVQTAVDAAGGAAEIDENQVAEIAEAKVNARVKAALSGEELEAAIVDLMPEQPAAGGVDEEAIKMAATEVLAERLVKFQKDVLPKLIEKVAKPLLDDGLATLAEAAGGAPAGLGEAEVKAIVTEYADLKAGQIEKSLKELAAASVPQEGGGVDEAKVQEIVKAAVAEVAASAPQAGGGVDEAKVQELVKGYADAKAKETEGKVAEVLKTMAAEQRAATPAAGDGGAGGGAAPEVTPDFINQIANSDAFMKMIENRFRVMAEYLKSDVIPKEFKKLSGG